jgi:hypothetical protein
MDLPAWGSFEGWSALVRAAVAWVGLPDPGRTRLLLQERSDTLAECMTAILAGWEQMDPERQGLTAAEVVQKLYPRPTRDAPTPQPWHGDFRSALESLLGKPDARALGTRLRSYRRRLFAGKYIDRVGTEHQAAKWGVYDRKEFQRAEPPEGECGECGECVSPPGKNAQEREAVPAAPAFSRAPAGGGEHSPHSPHSPEDNGEVDPAGTFTTPWD